jgi:hypothetical protein
MSIRRYGPGKYYTILDSLVYGGGFFDAEESYEDGNGAYALVYGGPELVRSVQDFAKGDKEELTPEELKALKATKGIIFFERSDGIVESEWFDSKKELDKAWKGIEDEIAEAHEESGEGMEERGAAAASDEDSVNELVLYIDNDGDLYRQQTTSIMKNLAKKILKGTYDSTKAVKLWQYLADSGAQKYTKEFGNGGKTSFGVFTSADRKEVARELAKTFEASVKNDELDLEKLAKGK